MWDRNLLNTVPVTAQTLLDINDIHPALAFLILSLTASRFHLSMITTLCKRSLPHPLTASQVVFAMCHGIRLQYNHTSRNDRKKSDLKEEIVIKGFVENSQYFILFLGSALFLSF